MKTLADVQGYIKRKLGWPTVSVELTEEQLVDAVEDALRMFNRYLMVLRPNIVRQVYTADRQGLAQSPKMTVMSITEHGTTARTISFNNGADVTADNERLWNMSDGTLRRTDALQVGDIVVSLQSTPYQDQTYNQGVIPLGDEVLGVHYCCFLMPNQLLNYTQINVFEIMSRMVYPEMPMGEWYMIRMFYEMFQKVRGTEPEWHYDRDDNTLYLDCHGGPFDVFYLTSTAVTIESILQGGKRRYTDDFLTVALSKAKQTLAEVRGKFGGVPVPGGSLTTNAERLIAKAQEDIDKIETRLRRAAQARVMPVIG